MPPAEKRLKSAKVAALNIRQRKEELKSQLAAIDSDGNSVVRAAPGESADRRLDQDVAMTDVDADTEAGVAKKDGENSSGSSSSSSESDDSDSDSDSESDSDDGGAPLERVGL